MPKPTRSEAIAMGKELGVREADSRKETGHNREQRVRRAMAYAAWEFAGKPASSASQHTEFGVESSSLTDSLERSVFARLLKAK